MSARLRQKWELLQTELRRHRRVLVAFSGGCDSVFLAAAARRELGAENMLAVTAVSASLPYNERQRAQELAAELEIPHRFLDTEELNDPNYTQNSSARCFFCKNELFSRLAPLAVKNQMILADGFNFSDRADFRPGFQAAQKWRVEHPLDRAELTKPNIRALSRWLGLRTWNKPASPCLSSRIPYGTAVSESILRQIELAETVLHAEGFKIARVRHHGALARIEVPLKNLSELLETQRWTRIKNRLSALGYEQIEADSRGFQSGRLNETVNIRASSANL